MKRAIVVLLGLMIFSACVIKKASKNEIKNETEVQKYHSSKLTLELLDTTIKEKKRKLTLQTELLEKQAIESELFFLKELRLAYLRFVSFLKAKTKIKVVEENLPPNTTFLDRIYLSSSGKSKSWSHSLKEGVFDNNPNFSSTRGFGEFSQRFSKLFQLKFYSKKRDWSITYDTQLRVYWQFNFRHPYHKFKNYLENFDSRPELREKIAKVAKPSKWGDSVEGQIRNFHKYYHHKVYRWIRYKGMDEFMHHAFLKSICSIPHWEWDYKACAEYDLYKDYLPYLQKIDRKAEYSLKEELLFSVSGCDHEKGQTYLNFLVPKGFHDRINGDSVFGLKSIKKLESKIQVEKTNANLEFDQKYKFQVTVPEKCSSKKPFIRRLDHTEVDLIEIDSSQSECMRARLKKGFMRNLSCSSSGISSQVGVKIPVLDKFNKPVKESEDLYLSFGYRWSHVEELTIAD